VTHDDRRGRFRRRWQADEQGAALIEFALVLTVFMALVLGLFTGGLAYEHQQEITNSAREAGRYAATLAEDACTPSSNCGGVDWAQQVQAIAVQRSNGVLIANQVCVALVSGLGSAPTPLGANYTTKSDGTACYVDNSSDSGQRVQVSVTRSDSMSVILFSKTLTLSSDATAKYEPSS
jgi:Flp pilus assembly protein TadG